MKGKGNNKSEGQEKIGLSVGLNIDFATKLFVSFGDLRVLVIRKSRVSGEEKVRIDR